MSLENLTLFGSSEQILVIFAVIVGLMVWTVGKGWDKLRDGTITKFDPKWIYTGIVAFVGSIIPAMAFMPQAMGIFEEAAGTYGIIGGMVIVGFMAYGINGGINYTWKRVEGKAEATVLKSGKFDKIIEEKVQKQLKAMKQKE